MSSSVSAYKKHFDPVTNLISGGHHDSVTLMKTRLDILVVPIDIQMGNLISSQLAPYGVKLEDFERAKHT